MHPLFNKLILRLKENKAKKIIRWSLVSITVAVTSSLVISPFYQIGFNMGDSLPGYVFLIKKNEFPHKGEMVAFYPPKNRFYRHAWFVKIIVGTEGDKIRYDGNKLFIGDNYYGVAKSLTRNGEPLEKTENKTIEYHHIFAWSPHKDSYDSRYKDFNTIPYSSIVGRAIRLF